MKTSLLGFLSIAATAAFALPACDDSSNPTVAPTIAITTPANNASVTLATDADLSLAISFTTTNFVLRSAGSSGCGVGCGHVNLLIDGAACNVAAQSQNTQGAASPLNARFALCAAAEGNHTVTLALHNNDNTPLTDAKGVTIATSINVTTTRGNSGVPSLAITSPADGATVTLGIDVNKSVPIAFATENFTLAAAGTSGCGSGCGHVNLTIDGTACNAQGSTYNASGSSSPINALFGLCPTPIGTHTLVMTLRNDDDSLVAAASPTSITFTTN